MTSYFTSITLITFFFLGSFPECGLLCFFRDTAVDDESMAAVLFTNLLSQLEKVRLLEQNFLQRHNMKIIQQQLQVHHCHLIPSLKFTQACKTPQT